MANLYISRGLFNLPKVDCSVQSPKGSLDDGSIIFALQTDLVDCQIKALKLYFGPTAPQNQNTCKNYCVFLKVQFDPMFGQDWATVYIADWQTS